MGSAIKRTAKAVSTMGFSEVKKKGEELLTPDMPSLPDAPEVAPVADDETSKIANRRKAAKRRAGGRAGTILTEGSTLG